MSRLLALLFIGCASGPEAPAAPVPVAAPAPTAAPAATAAPAPAATPGAADEVTFEYTPLDLDKCERKAGNEEEAWVSLQCPGLPGVPVFVDAGDLRYDTDFGVTNGRWESRPGFNELGSTVEWRLRDGVPFAAILRYIEEGPDGQKSEFLGVFKVGTAEAVGCLVEWVPSSAQPSQNEAARAVADSRAAGFDCMAQ